jgi:hypothetical protein
VALAGVACKGKQGQTTNAGAAPDDLSKLQDEQSDVLASRDQIEQEREKIAADRAALDEKRKDVVAQGGDTKSLDDEEAALSERAKALDDHENQLYKKLDTLMSGYQKAVVVPAAGDATARREAEIAIREKDVAVREDAVAKRESALSDREKADSLREKDLCAGTVTQVIQPTVAPPPPGTQYSRHDVEPVIGKAHKKMNDLGVLDSDVPPGAEVLEKQATDAMAKGDFAKAKFAADAFFANIDAMKIDKAFIQSKIGRLNAVIRGKKLDDASQKAVDDLFQQATADYGDGKFASANGKLNRIYSSLP